MKLFLVLILSSFAWTQSVEVDYWNKTNLEIDDLKSTLSNGGCLRDEYYFLGCVESINTILKYSDYKRENLKAGIFWSKIKNYRSKKIEITGKFFFSFYDPLLVDAPQKILPLRGVERESILLQAKNALGNFKKKNFIRNDKKILSILDHKDIDFSVPLKKHIGEAINSYTKIAKGAYHYIKPSEEFRKRKSGELVEALNIGAVFSTYQNKVFIKHIFNSGPAYNVGLSRGDEVIEIEGASSFLNISSLMKKLEGFKDKAFEITVRKVHKKTLKKYRLKRESFLRPKVYTNRYEDVFQIVVSSFYEKGICEKVYSLLKKIPGEETIIVDLRGNGGGFLDEATCLAGLFFDQDVTREKVVSFEPLENSVINFSKDKSFFSNGREEGLFPVRYKGKVTILIDGNSASASEVFSGILKWRKRAKISGYRSFGKGSVLLSIWDSIKDVYEFSPVSLFYIDGEYSPQGQGILPHFNLSKYPQAEDRKFVRSSKSYFHPLIATNEVSSSLFNNAQVVNSNFCLKSKTKVNQAHHVNEINDHFHGDWELYYTWLAHSYCP